MRTFRGKEVIGWRVLAEAAPANLELELSKLMNKYEFIDCQYNIAKDETGMVFSALVLIAKKNQPKTLKY